MRNSLLAALFLFAFSTLSAQFAFSGIFSEADAEYEYAHQMNWEDLLKKHQELDAKGFRLIDIETAKTGAHRYYWGIWKKDEARSILKRVESWDSLVIEKRLMAADTFMMDEIEAYTHDGKEYYLAVWVPGASNHKVRKLTSWEGLINDYKDLTLRKLQMVDIEGFEAKDGTTHYLALYQWRGADFRTHLFRSPDFDSFLIDKIYRYKSGNRLFDYERFEKRGTAFYVGLYKEAGYSGRLEDRYSQEDFSKLMAEQKEQGNIVVVDIDVYGEEEEER